MKSISVTILALVLLPAGLAPAAPPVRPAAAANTSGPLDPEQICQQSTAANIAAYKRFARKLKASAKYFLEIEDVEGRPPLPPGGDARIKNQVLQSLSRCYKTGEGAVYIALQSISGCWSDACQEEESVKIRTSLFFAKGTQRIAVPLPVGTIYNSPGQDVYHFHSLAGAFDYDGDGVPEVLVMNQEYERGEGGEHRTFKLQSIKDGKLVDYPYSPPLREDSRWRILIRTGGRISILRGPMLPSMYRCSERGMIGRRCHRSSCTTRFPVDASHPATPWPRQRWPSAAPPRRICR